ncbi:uncharacterized protein Dana_GF25169, isoform C [Drosophila ananassae]|uniref:Uncharacterized protein, isoform C n=1 Tax=Drosophila ananassae TaxID=7217 RepID=A0A0P8Y8Z6_DROAN|nr:uncharacterized protein Dana_GF25169, isoform C [Drosophila ananassae]
MVKSMKMHKMQNALSARLMVNMVMAGPARHPHTPPPHTICWFLANNYGQTGSAEELQSDI